MSRTYLWKYAQVWGPIGAGVGVLLFIISQPYIFEKSIIEELEHPRRVVGRDGATLILDDNTRARLTGVDELGMKTPLLDAACERGVDLCDGRPVGLIKIHHGCGNDPVRRHFARVDLSDLVQFAGEGKGRLTAAKPPGLEGYSKYGWDVSDYYVFKQWREYAPSVAQATSTHANGAWYERVQPVKFDEPGLPITHGTCDDTFPREPDVRMSGEQALAQLLGCKTFANSAVGYGGEESLQVHAFRVLLKQPEAAAIYRNLLKRGNTAGQLYALCGLWLTDRAAFEKEIIRYENLGGEIWTQFGCTGSKEPISEIVVSRHPCALRLRPGQTIKEWRSTPQCDSYALDIRGGGYALEFSNE